MSAGSRISLSDNISDSKLPLASLKRSRTPTSQYPLQPDALDSHQDHKRRVVKDDSQSLRTLACPFYKFDPVRYSETDVSCSSVHLASISRLKQHLYGVHWTPYMSNGIAQEHYIRSDSASAISQNAASAAKIGSHGSKRLHDASKDLTNDQYLEFKVKRRREGKEDAWYRLYTTALPGAELPASPYVDPSNKAPRFFERFRAQGPEAFSHRIREQFRARVQSSGQLLPQEERTEFQEEILDVAVSTVLEEFLRTSVRHEGGQSTIFTDPSPASHISPPSYTEMGVTDNIEGQPQLKLGPPSSGGEKCGDIPIPRASSSFLGPLEPSPRFGWSPHEEPFPEDTSPARSGVTTSGYMHGDTNGYMKTQHGIGPAGDSEQQIPPTSSYDNTFTADCPGETAQSAWEDLDQIPGLPKYGDVWPGLTIIDKSALKTPGDSDVASSESQTVSFASQGTTTILDQRKDLVRERERKRPSTKSSGKARQRMSCLSIKGPNKDKCPSSCLIYSSFDIYSIQRHEKIVHGDLYSKHQEVLLASLGKKKDAESRWLALFEVVSGEEHHGRIDPYYHQPDLDDTITAASKTTPFKLADTSTPSSLARIQTYKILQDRIIEGIDASKPEIERHRNDTELEITSHVHRVLHQHAERFRRERALAKCEAISALRLDFDAGKDIKPEEVIARYASQVSWNPFEVREVLADVGAVYPDVSFLDVAVDATNS